MSSSPTIESRLELLEREMAELRRRLPSGSSANWLEKIAGSQEGEPEFNEVLELGRKARAADRPVDNGGA
jgi:hypothetical protein